MKAKPVLTIGYVLPSLPASPDDPIVSEVRHLQEHALDLLAFVLRPPVKPALAARQPFRVSIFDGDRPSPAAPRGGSRQAAWLASEVLPNGIRHFHAHSARAADVAQEVSKASGLGFSFTLTPAEMRREGFNFERARSLIETAQFVATFTGADARRLVLGCGPGVARKVHVVKGGLDVAQIGFAAAEERQRDWVLAVGNCDERSGFVDLIDAIGRLRNAGRPVRLTIVGEGPLAPLLRRRAQQEAEGAIEVLSGVQRARRLAMMRSATLLAMPSTSAGRDWREGIPRAMLEAMASGLPVVATSIEEVGELIEDGTSGRIIAPADPFWLAGTLETLLDQPHVRSRMAREARERVARHFSRRRNVAGLARLFAASTAPEPLVV